jgi:hypothetical protein
MAYKEEDMTEEQRDLFNEMAGQFFSSCIKQWNDALGITIFRDMPMNLQIHCFVTGMISAGLTVPFRFNKDERNEYMEYFADVVIPNCRDMAERQAEVELDS